MLKTGIELYALPTYWRHREKAKPNKPHFNPFLLLTGAEQDGSIGSRKSEAFTPQCCSWERGQVLPDDPAELLLPEASPGVPSSASTVPNAGLFTQRETKHLHFQTQVCYMHL